MPNITFAGTPTPILNQLPPKGSRAVDFQLVNSELSLISLSDYKKQKLVLNIFPSIDTEVCAASVKHFNAAAAALTNTHVLCISRDLPFAQKRFCGAEDIENVTLLSDFDTGQFGIDYGVIITGGPLQGLFARAIVVIDAHGQIAYTELVKELTNAPDYDTALKAIDEA